MYIFLILLSLFISKFYNEWIYIAYGFNIALLITGIFNLLILFYIYKFKLSDFTTIKIKKMKKK